MPTSHDTTALTSPDVIIIGGGIHGCSTALHLALLGVKVLVIEKDHAGRHASGVNAGGVRRLGRHPAEIPLSVASMELWHDIRALVDDDCGFEMCAQVKVAESEADLATLRGRVEMVRNLGFEHEELIDRAELRRLLPAVAEHCVGGIVVRGDGAANPYRTTLAFKRKAESLGVRFLEGTRVNGLERVGTVWRVETSAGTHEAPKIVNCAGAWAGRIAEMLGEPVPLEAIAPMMIITAPMPRFLTPVVGATGRPLSFKQMPNGTVMIGGGRLGTPHPGSNTTDIDFPRLALSAQTVLDLFPVMRAAQVLRCWAGIEARMPDEIPVLGPSSTSEGVFHAFGFSAHGFQLGPGCGALMARLVTGAATNLPLEPFDIRRFHQAH